MTEQATAGPPADTSGAPADLAGKYLTFVLADEFYGLEILTVREIIQMCKITPVPRTPEYVKGVINLRGMVIPIIDLRRQFGLAEKEYTDRTCIIVVKLGGREVGLIVDEVWEVLDIAGEDIEPTPELGTGVDTEFILGISKTAERVTILLDITQVLGGATLPQAPDAPRE